MHLFCYATESGAPGLPPKAAASVRRGHCPELLQMLKARDIAVRQRSDLVLALLALVKDRRDGKAVLFRSLDGVDSVLEDHGAAALRAKMLHRAAEDDGLVLAVPDLAACEDRVEEVLNAAAPQRRFDEVAVCRRRDADVDALCAQLFQKPGQRPALAAPRRGKNAR